ncbi:MAG: hypothetical protein ACYTEL_25235 [Planctomycetota bacterium]|jgi:hypothetical protein
MKILNRSIIAMFVIIMLLGLNGRTSAQVAADMAVSHLSISLQNENKEPFPQDVTPDVVTYVEDFPDPLGGWTSRWFYTNTNAESIYVANGYSCDPDYRGNQLEGIWISDDKGCNNLVVQSPVRIDFFNNFGDTATSFSLDQFACAAGVTFNIYDKDGALVFSDPLPSDCWNWANYSYTLSNGISAFEYSYTGAPVEGNVSIDNITIVIETVTWASAYHTLFDPTANQLEIMRAYRDDVLSVTASGRKYTGWLYQNSKGALAVLVGNPELMAQAKVLIDANIDAVSNVIDGYEGIIYNTDEIVAFLDAYAGKAPPVLKALARLVKWDMLRKQRRGGLFLGFRLQ